MRSAEGSTRRIHPRVALTLALDGLLWTGDKVLKAGLTERGFDRFFTP